MGFIKWQVAHSEYLDDSLHFHFYEQSNYTNHQFHIKIWQKGQLPLMLFIILYQEEGSLATVLGVYKSLASANGKCIGKAAELDVTLTTLRHSVFKDTEPMRWDTTGGSSCWVEGHEVWDRDGSEDWGEVKVREDVVAVLE
mgnify:CR=1 FL=1